MFVNWPYQKLKKKNRGRVYCQYRYFSGCNNKSILFRVLYELKSSYAYHRKLYLAVKYDVLA